MKIKTYNPREEEWKGGDSAIIKKISGMYVPMYLSEGVCGLGQVINSKDLGIILFKDLNLKFFEEFVSPLADRLDVEGEVVLKKLGIKKN